MNMVALGRIVLTRREHVIAFEPKDRGLLGLTLRFSYEVRDQAAHIVNTKSGPFDPAQFEDAPTRMPSLTSSRRQRPVKRLSPARRWRHKVARAPATNSIDAEYNPFRITRRWRHSRLLLVRQRGTARSSIAHDSASNDRARAVYASLIGSALKIFDASSSSCFFFSGDGFQTDHTILRKCAITGLNRIDILRYFRHT
jgi:hypothetical protein